MSSSQNVVVISLVALLDARRVWRPRSLAPHWALSASLATFTAGCPTPVGSSTTATPSVSATPPTSTTTTAPTPPAPGPLGVDAPSVSATSPIGVIAAQLLALPDGPLPGPEALTLPPGSSLRTGGAVKRHTFSVVDGAAVASVRFSLRDGTWEGPAGNSASRMVDPVVETIELEVNGTVSVAAPGQTSVVVTEPWRLPSLLEQPPVAVHHWGAGTYVRQGSATTPFWLTRSAGRAPFHVVESERAALDDVLVSVTGALKAGEADLVAIMAQRYGGQRASAPPGPLGGDAPVPVAVYAFPAGRIEVMSPQYARVFLDVPLRLPKLFQTHGMTRIVTHFAHDRGQMAQPLRGDGFTIVPDRYRIEQEHAHSDEDGDPRVARFSALSVVAAPGQHAAP